MKSLALYHSDTVPRGCPQRRSAASTDYGTAMHARMGILL